jgi:hypothetical protein
MLWCAVYYVTTSNARGSVEMPGHGERELEGILYRASFVEPLDPGLLAGISLGGLGPGLAATTFFYDWTYLHAGAEGSQM